MGWPGIAVPPGSAHYPTHWLGWLFKMTCVLRKNIRPISCFLSRVNRVWYPLRGRWRQTLSNLTSSPKNNILSCIQIIYSILSPSKGLEKLIPSLSAESRMGFIPTPERERMNIPLTLTVGCNIKVIPYLSWSDSNTHYI